MIVIDIDTPKTCMGCFAAHWPDVTDAYCAIEADKDSDYDVTIYTDISDHMYHLTKPDWCPIKTIDMTIKVDQSTEEAFDYICEHHFELDAKMRKAVFAVMNDRNNNRRQLLKLVEYIEGVRMNEHID